MCATWTAKLCNQIASIILMPRQTASEDQQYKVKVRHYQRFIDDWTTWGSRSPSGVDSSLQIATDEVAQWTTTNKMALNYDKTKEMHIWFKKKRHTSRR